MDNIGLFDSDRVGLALDRDGIAIWPERMPTGLVSAITAHLLRAPVYNAHVWAQSDKRPRTLDECPDVACTTQETLITAPYFLEFVDRFTPIAQAYIGQEPALLYSVNAFWTMPSPAPANPLYQGFHRDCDDRKFLAMFIYGTDVRTLYDGPHVYERGSHRSYQLAGDMPPCIARREFYGDAGTIIFADTSGLHFGAKPVHARRLIFWARWGVSEPPASYTFDQLYPVDRARVPYPFSDHLRLVMK